MKFNFENSRNQILHWFKAKLSTQEKQKTKRRPQLSFNVRSVIYTYLDIFHLSEVISKLSSKDRKKLKSLVDVK